MWGSATTSWSRRGPACSPASTTTRTRRRARPSAPPEQAWQADVVLRVNGPTVDEIALLKDGATIVALLAPAFRPELVDALAQRPITALAMDAVPRISRAQSLDVLSSMANIAGYRAVIEAAHVFGRFFTGQVTAAGKVPPAKVLIAGAGVAGLAAIGAANSLGAIVRATDPRPEVADQVRSLGGEFLSVMELEVSSDGYARATSEDYNRLAAELYTEQAKDVDIIITTALIPGRPAPKLMTAEQVALMRSGSVIVDMAAAMGGNVEGSVAGKAIVTDNGVTIIGYTDLAGRLPAQASQLYGTNLVNLMKLLTPERTGSSSLDFDDVVPALDDGRARRRDDVAAAAGAGLRRAGRESGAGESRRGAGQGAARRSGSDTPLIAVRRCSRSGSSTPSRPTRCRSHFTVLMLADRRRLLRDRQGPPRAAHAADVGHQRDLGDHRRRRDAPARRAWTTPRSAVLATIAILLASINVFGGFAVTRRMLGMFNRG